MPRHPVLIDTRPDSVCIPDSTDHYGDDIFVREDFGASGQRYVTVCGPDGQVCLPDWIWKNIADTAEFVPTAARKVA